MLALIPFIFGAVVMGGLCMAAEITHREEEKKMRIEAARRRYSRSSL